MTLVTSLTQFKPNFIVLRYQNEKQMQLWTVSRLEESFDTIYPKWPKVGRQCPFKLKTQKCLFFQRSIDILGRIATGDSLSMSDKDMAVVQKWPVPRNAKEVARFTGLCSYHRAFIDSYAEISKPLYSLLKKGAKFSRDEQHQIAIEKLKEALTSSPILGLPRPEGTFIWVFW